jgi:hypothetical protein
MTRLSDVAMTPAGGAMAIEAHREAGDAAVDALAARGEEHAGHDAEEGTRLAEKIRARGGNLLDAWERLAKLAQEELGGKRAYSRFDKDKAAGKPLLYMITDADLPDDGTDEAKFAAPTSMRDVEGQVHLWIERRVLGGTS